MNIRLAETSLLHVPEVPFALVTGVLFVFVSLVGRSGAGTTSATFAALFLLLGLVGVSRLGPLWAAVTGLCTWGFLTGFVVNEGGQLTFTVHDLERLLLTVSCAAATGALVWLESVWNRDHLNLVWSLMSHRTLVDQ